MRKLRIIVCSAIAAVSVAAVVAGVTGLVKADDKSFDDGKLALIADTYTVGDSVTLPAASFGATAAVSAVKSPDGTLKNAATYTFSEAGIYTVAYYAEVNGEYLCKEKQVKVYDKLYSFDKKNATATYEREQVFYTNNDDSDRKNGVKINYDETTTLSGLKLTLTEQATFTYKKIVDISKNKWDEEIFRATLIPNSYNNADLGRVIIRLTDAYDSENYIEYLIKFVKQSTLADDITTDCTTYILARAHNQKFQGLECGRNDGLYNNGIRKDNSGGGNYSHLTFIGFRKDLSTQGDVSLSFDYESLTAHNLDYWSTRSDAKDKTVVMDLDEEAFNTELWHGFTTGEAVLSVYGENFYSSSATMFIKSIFGDEGEDFKENIAKDETAPEVTVNFGGYAGELPFAVAGKPYPIFPATASDLQSGVNKPVASVYRDYYSDAKTKITVLDGRFTPDKAGSYTIEYTATDYLGNESVKTVDIVCVNDDGKFKVTLADDKVISAATGELIPVADYTVKGYSGQYSVQINVNGDEITGGTFRPMKAGEYSVEISATDYASRTATAKYAVTVTDGENPVFESIPVLPKYFIQNYKQTLPDVYAYDFADGGKRIKATVKVQEGDRAERTVEGSVTPTTGDTFTRVYDLKITFVATGKSGVSQTTIIRPCYSVYTDEVGKIQKNSLFVTENGTIASYEKVNADSSDFATYTLNKDGKIEFINRLNAYDVTSEFNIFADGRDFEKLSVYLTDSVDENIALKLTYAKNGKSSVYCSLNDGTRYLVEDYSFYSQNTRIIFSYSDKDKTFKTAGGKFTFKADKTKSGAAFDGFPSGRVYLTYGFENVGGKAKIAVRKVGNQILADMKRDNADPVFTITRDYALNYDLNTEFVIGKAFASDMINPDVKNRLTVTGADGKPMTATDGTILNGVDGERDYTVVLSAYGTYKMSYSIDDVANPVEISVTVIDRRAPVITPSAPNKVYKAGDTFTLSATATDDTFGEEDIAIYASVTLPTGRVKSVLLQYKFDETVKGETVTHFVKTSFKLKFDAAGKYKITYTAKDGNGNQSRVTYDITVNG